MSGELAFALIVVVSLGVVAGLSWRRPMYIDRRGNPPEIKRWRR